MGVFSGATLNIINGLSVRASKLMGDNGGDFIALVSPVIRRRLLVSGLKTTKQEMRAIFGYYRERRFNVTKLVTRLVEIMMMI